MIVRLTHILSFCVHYVRQYFLVIIKDRPLQLWDLKNLTVLREMPSNFSSITALVCITYSVVICKLKNNYSNLKVTVAIKFLEVVLTSKEMIGT